MDIMSCDPTFQHPFNVNEATTRKALPSTLPTPEQTAVAEMSDPPAQRAGDENPPMWLTRPCPTWCNNDHADQHFAEDRRHNRLYPQMPLSQMDMHQSGGEWAPDRLDVWLTQPITGAPTVELSNESWREEIRLTPGEARELAAVLLHAAEAADGGAL